MNANAVGTGGLRWWVPGALVFGIGCSDPRARVVSDGVSGADSADTGTACPVAMADATDGATDAPPDRSDASARSDGSSSRTQGSALVLTPDADIAVVANRTAGTVAVFATHFDTTPPTPVLITSFPNDATSAPWSEPWSVVIGDTPDGGSVPPGDTAYVITRNEQMVHRIDGLHRGPPTPTTMGPTSTMMAPTGSEPTGIAITPSGAALYIANFGEGTITVVRTSDMTVTSRIDLNAALVRTGVLGDPASVPVTSALAHPRAIVITDHGTGDDTAETVYATEFFSQTLPGTIDLQSQADVSRQGLVYAISIAPASRAPTIQVIPLAPVANTGFMDGNCHPTGCFPNQLYATTWAGDVLYVSSVCASPQGPIGESAGNFQTLQQPVIFAIDTTTQVEDPSRRIVLSAAFRERYDHQRVPDDPVSPYRIVCDGARRRMPLIPNDLRVVQTAHAADAAPDAPLELFVSAYGANAVFRAPLGADGSLDQNALNMQREAYIDLQQATYDESGTPTVTNARLPVGIAFSATGHALVASENDRQLAVVSTLPTSAIYKFAAVVPTATPDLSPVNEGRRFFVTGAGRWSYNAQAFSSCEGCHPDGQSDGVTWFFPRGPRQPPSLAGVYDATGSNQRLLSWTASFDEVQDLENITRGTAGGVGAIVWQMSDPAAIGDRIAFTGAELGSPHSTPTPQDFLNGSAASIAHHDAGVTSVVPYYDQVEAYAQTIRAPRAPTHPDATAIALGQSMFQAHHCAACHGGPNWTISRLFYPPGELNNGIGGALQTRLYALPAGFPPAVNPPALAGWGLAPFRAPPPDLAWDAAVANANDAVQCALRAVGTYGVSPAGVPVLEVRDDMTTAAQGTDGFNPPSLVGLSTSAPYFHAGNARTLIEALGDPAFLDHAAAFDAVKEPLTAVDARNLAAYLLSIDDGYGGAAPSTAPHLTASEVQGTLTFNPDLCSQFLPR